MVEIECLVCGKTIKMPKYINPEKYDGQVVCQECKSRLHVKLVQGKVQKYKLVEKSMPPSVPITRVEIIKPHGSGQQVREGDKSNE